ncbi:LamG-like jellyroll fold domain-containing protein, partial [Patescibacteria group bacterium]
YASSTVAGEGRKFFLNGEFDSSQITTGTISNTSLALGIGYDPGTGNRLWDGLIDEVKLWNYELTAAEIQAEYESSGTKRNYAQTFPRNGLVGYWNMESSDMTSTTLFDKSGKGNHGTNTGFYIYRKPTSTQGKILNAIDFDGEQGVVTLGTGIDDLLENGCTFAAWIKPDQISDTGGIVSNKDGGIAQTKDGIGIVQASDDITISLNDGSSSVYIGRKTTGNEINIGTWYHVVGTWDGSFNSSGFQIYINGVRTDDDDVELGTVDSFNQSPDPMRIGFAEQVADKYFDGAIDEVMIWDRVLSAQEVGQVYKYRREYRQ